MTVTEPTTNATDSASCILSDFVRAKAEQAALELGFSWIGTATAPSTYQQLRGAFKISLQTGAPLPISNQFCDSSIFPDPSDNVAFRFWHDVSHVRLGLSFDLEDELELALWHLSELEVSGHPKGGDVYRLFESDLIGQVLLFALIRRFAINQQAFSNTIRAEGLLPGVLAEIRRLT